MDYRRLFLTLGAQVGVFAAGALALLALTHGLYATAVLCLLVAAGLANFGATQTFIRLGQDILRRHSGSGAIYTAEQSRQRLQVLLDQTPSPLLLRPADGQVIAVNRAARQLFNVPYALTVATRRALLGETEDFGRAGGQIRWQGATYMLDRTVIENGEDVSDLMVMTDISAEVRAAEAGALRDLLRVLNHELMNALTPMASMSKSALDLLHDDTPQSRAMAIKALERVVARTESLSGFLEAYRMLSRLPPPMLRPVDVAEWSDGVAQSFAAQWTEKGVNLELDLAHGGLALMDADQMSLGVTNLLNNAAQAALEKPDPCVRLRIVRDHNTLTFTVEDSGAGISPDAQDRIFLPFYTTKETGTGVGLSLARQIVQGHGGWLSLTPTAGRPDALGGACFGFSLKVTQ